MALKGGNLFIGNLALSKTVADPGETLGVEVRVENGALAIVRGSLDACSSGGTPCSRGLFDNSGYCVEVEVRSNGQFVGSKEGCVRKALIGTGKRVFAFETEVPQAEMGEIAATLTAVESGESESINQTYDINFTPPSNGNGNGGGNGNGNGNGGGDDDIFGVSRETALLVGGGLAIGAGLFLAGRDGGRRPPPRRQTRQQRPRR